jgi:hypothetical protein
MRRAGRTGFRLEGAAALTGLVVAWQIASYFFPPFLFPSVPAIARHVVDIFVSWSTMLDALATAASCWVWSAPSCWAASSPS